MIIQRILPHYRVEFFSRLADRLIQRNIQLKVVYGQEFEGTVPRSVRVDERWAKFVPNHYCIPRSLGLVWQNCLGVIGGSDLVIIEQANRLLMNYLLMVLRYARGLKVAYWGHGRNLQASAVPSVRERLKQGLVKSVDWWFAYTSMSAEIVKAAGFPAGKITTVANTIDTESFASDLAAVSEDDVAALRASLNLRAGPVALYCGGMYPDKRLSFLLEAAEKLNSRIEGFNFLLIGGGPDSRLVEEKAVETDWLHYLGPVFGADKAAYFRLADVMLMPGLVGLAIVDSFVAGLPMITTDIPIHSPEISYLESGVNGVISRYEVSDYVDAVAKCLEDSEYRQSLVKGCGISAKTYTLDAMVENYAEGIVGFFEQLA